MPRTEDFKGLLLLAGLLGQKHRVDVGKHTTGRDRHTSEQLVELLIVADGELDVTGHNAGLLVVLGGVTGELEDLSGEVLKDSSEIDGGTSTNSLGVSSVLEESGDSSDGELKSSLSGS